MDRYLKARRAAALMMHEAKTGVGEEFRQAMEIDRVVVHLEAILPSHLVA